jgi:CRP-like cAMP-binding protein/di/tricarboxylate transporter
LSPRRLLDEDERVPHDHGTLTPESRADSATALARTPLFAQLGRLELARLAGELEELRFAAGRVIVREGDPPDGFYVINAGWVDVVAGAPPEGGAAVTSLGPGEVFGEMALLADSPRTASVVARGEVTVWRLPRARFDALLAQERAIARSIEQALSRRLSSATHEAGALRALGHGLVERIVAGLSPEARGLLHGLAARARWPDAALRHACEASGTTAALAELEAIPALLRRDASGVAVEPAAAALLPAPADGPPAGWLLAAADALREAGDPVAALDLELRARARDRVARALAEPGDGLAAAAGPGDIDRWLAHVGDADPELAGRLAAMRARLRPAGAGAPAPGPAVRPGLRERFVPLGRQLGTPHAIGTLAALALFVAGCLVPVPAGLERAGLVALGGIVATVPLLVASVLPDYVVMLLLTLVLVVPGLVPPAQILGGFAQPAWIMIFTLLAVGTAVSRSGLMFRLVLLSLQRLPARFVPQSLVLCATGVALSAGLTSGSTRIALGVPIARGIADAMGFGPRSPGAAAVGLLTFFTYLQMGELFLTGTFTGLVVHDLLPPAAKAQITWWRWFFVALPPFVVVSGATYLTVLLLFRPQAHARVNLEAVRLQQALLGPLTRHEIWSAVTLVALVAGFATRPYHGIAPAWLAVAGFLFLFVLGTLDQTALGGGGTLGLLVYAGVILSLGNVFATLHIDAWLTALVQGGMPPIVKNPYGFVLVVAAIAFVLHFFVPWMTASTILALVTMPIAEGLGFHPFVPVLVALVAGDHTLLPYVNSGYAILYFASEGALFTHRQARAPLVLEAVFRVAGLLLSVPVWQLMGLL